LNCKRAYCDAHNHCQPWYEKAFHRDLPTLSERIDARPRAAARMRMTSVRPLFLVFEALFLLADSTMAAIAMTGISARPVDSTNRCYTKLLPAGGRSWPLADIDALPNDVRYWG